MRWIHRFPPLRRWGLSSENLSFLSCIFTSFLPFYPLRFSYKNHIPLQREAEIGGNFIRLRPPHQSLRDGFPSRGNVTQWQKGDCDERGDRTCDMEIIRIVLFGDLFSPRLCVNIFTCTFLNSNLWLCIGVRQLPLPHCIATPKQITGLFWLRQLTAACTCCEWWYRFGYNLKWNKKDRSVSDLFHLEKVANYNTIITPLW